VTRLLILYFTKEVPFFPIAQRVSSYLKVVPLHTVKLLKGHGVLSDFKYLYVNTDFAQTSLKIQGGSNMTGTICV
jgi:hypothetical protein